MIKPINTNQAPAAIGPYSQAMIANGFIFCSGQVGVDPKTGVLTTDIETQTHQVLKNLQAVLKEAGCELQNVVKTTIYLVDMSDFAKVNEIYGSYFGETKPARATVQVSKLPQGKLPNPPLIEIEAIAISA